MAEVKEDVQYLSNQMIRFESGIKCKKLTTYYK